MPVVYGCVFYKKRGITGTRKTQYRSLLNGSWVVDELPEAELLMVLRAGDAWITGPREGSLEPDLSRTFQSVLDRGTEASVPCWFGIWEGYSYLTEAQSAAPAIKASGRRWHLFREPLDHLEQSLHCVRGRRTPAPQPSLETNDTCVAFCSVAVFTRFFDFKPAGLVETN